MREIQSKRWNKNNSVNNTERIDEQLSDEQLSTDVTSTGIISAVCSKTSDEVIDTKPSSATAAKLEMFSSLPTEKQNNEQG